MNLFNICSSLILNIIFIAVSFKLIQRYLNLSFGIIETLAYIGINSSLFIVGNLINNSIIFYFFALGMSIAFFILVFKLPTVLTFVYFSLKSVIFLNISFIFSKVLNNNLIVLSPFFNLSFLATLLLIISLTLFYSKKIFSDNIFSMAIYDFSPTITSLSMINILLVLLNSITNFMLLDNFNLICLNMLFVMSFYSIGCTFQNKYFNSKNANLELSNKTLQNLCDNTRTFNHDFHNIIQAIGGYIYINDMTGLKNYYYDILDDCRKMNTISKLTPEAIKNPAIYSILVSKYNMAMTCDIQMDFDFSTDLTNVNIRNYEFIRIVGILLDNAIEASKVCMDKKINVFFKQDHYKKLLIIENTYENKQISIDKIFEKNYTTKAKNTGLGLWEVKKIINKSSNLDLHTFKNNDYFSQQLEIYTA